MEVISRIPYTKIRSQTTIRFFKGLAIGPSSINVIITFTLINTLSILYEYDMYYKGQYLASAFGIVLEFISNVLMFITTFMDPGVIPQQIRKYETDKQMFQIPIAEQPTYQGKSFGVTQNNIFPQIKYCDECRIYRPVRTIHCGKCNHCVEIFDHHCAWIGVCIGKRNYKYFFMFCISLLTHISMCIVFIIYVFVSTLQQSNGDIVETLEKSIIIIIVFAISLIFFISLSFLVGYHFSLLRRGLTTNQDLKQLYSSHCYQPFDIASICFRLNGATLVHDQYLFKPWNQMVSIATNYDQTSTDRGRVTPLLNSSATTQ